MAEASGIDVEFNWRKDIDERVQQVDAEKERRREKMIEHHKRTLVEEKRLADTMRDVVGRKVRRFSFINMVVYTDRPRL